MGFRYMDNLGVVGALASLHLNEPGQERGRTMTEWRNHPTHAAESKAVKAALVEAGYSDVSVTHGKGTAWSWLHVSVSAQGAGAECYCDDSPDVGFCGNCREKRNSADSAVTQIAQEVTGRHGDYDGRILSSITLKEVNRVK